MSSQRAAVYVLTKLMERGCDEQVQLTQLFRSSSLSLRSHQQVGSCAHLRADYFKARVDLVYSVCKIYLPTVVTEGLETRAIVT